MTARPFPNASWPPLLQAGSLRGARDDEGARVANAASSSISRIRSERGERMDAPPYRRTKQKHRLTFAGISEKMLFCWIEFHIAPGAEKASGVLLLAKRCPAR
jgi:hypothetical protein